jgi:hypothetical protein
MAVLNPFAAALFGIVVADVAANGFITVASAEGAAASAPAAVPCVIVGTCAGAGIVLA